MAEIYCNLPTQPTKLETTRTYSTGDNLVNNISVNSAPELTLSYAYDDNKNVTAVIVGWVKQFVDEMVGYVLDFPDDQWLIWIRDLLRHPPVTWIAELHPPYITPSNWEWK